MKKGIILLITIFFIMAISALILKSLSDTDNFLKQSNNKFMTTQIQISLIDLKNEIGRLISENKDNVDDAIENGLFNSNLRIPINDLDIEFNLKKNEKIDINGIKNKESKKLEELFITNELFNYDIFVSIYNEKLQDKNNKVESYKQLNDIINTFKERTYNDSVLKLKEIIGFINIDNLYELNVIIKKSDIEINAQYLLKNDGKVEYFEISFK